MTVELTRWTESELPLLRRINAPEMTEHLGGPETDEQVVSRNQRYAGFDDPATSAIFVIRLAGPGEEGEGVGSVGYWEKQWRDTTVYEMGWSVLPGYQGRGIAVAAAQATVDIVRDLHRHRYVHAFPSVTNPASNAVCRKLGFALLEALDFEYPIGNILRCNDWRLDLHSQ